MAFRKFTTEVLLPDALAREEDGKPPSAHVFEEVGRLNINAMRLGPGPHLKGLTLMGGVVKPEQVSRVNAILEDVSDALISTTTSMR